RSPSQEACCGSIGNKLLAAGAFEECDGEGKALLEVKDTSMCRSTRVRNTGISCSSNAGFANPSVMHAWRSRTQ
ncbi:MAG: hypothetical protein WCP63_00680, partial [Cyanobium sp. ELA712]